MNFPRRILVPALALLALLAAGPAPLPARAEVEIPLGMVGLTGPDSVRLAVRVDSNECLMRMSEDGRAYLELVAWAGRFDVDGSKIALHMIGQGEVVPGSQRVETVFGKDGRVQRFRVSGEARLDNVPAGEAQQFQFDIGVKVLGQSFEHRPVEAYVAEDSLAFEEKNGAAIYRFDIVCDAAAANAPVRLALVRGETVAKDGSKTSADLEPLGIKIEPGGKARHSVQATFRGSLPEDRAGTYRFVAVGFDYFDRPFVVERSVELSPEAVSAK